MAMPFSGIERTCKTPPCAARIKAAGSSQIFSAERSRLCLGFDSSLEPCSGPGLCSGPAFLSSPAFSSSMTRLPHLFKSQKRHVDTEATDGSHHHTHVAEGLVRLSAGPGMVVMAGNAGGHDADRVPQNGNGNREQ